jgi:hypothetical protein
LRCTVTDWQGWRWLEAGAGEHAGQVRVEGGARRLRLPREFDHGDSGGDDHVGHLVHHVVARMGDALGRA